MTADANGHFTVVGLMEGKRYKLYAMKESAGYPDMSMGLYNPEDKATIAEAVPAGQTPTEVTVTLGAKAVRFAWRVTDASSGALVASPTVEFRRVDSGGGIGGSVRSNSYLIPADTDLRFEVSAPGYKTWYYPGTTAKEMAVPMHLTAGGHKLLEIQLQPAE